MKLENVKVGETYTLKVGKNLVAVTVKDVDANGKITVVGSSGKAMTVADAARLAPAAHGARGKAAAPKATKVARGRNVGDTGAPQAKEKRLGLVDAAIQVMKAAGKPMNCQEVVKAILEQKLWESAGKTPAATLYSSILRDIQKKGAEARFKKVERGQFALAE